MRAVVVAKKNAKWQLKKVPDPKPGPNQVLIRIRASGLCFTDVHITQGLIDDFPFPATLGHEPVGEIVELGAGVTSRKVGDRVGVPWLQSSCGRCEFCQRGRAMFCETAVGTGAQIGGGHAELMVAFADATQLIPDGLSFEQAAPIFCAGYTVWSGLRFVEPKPAERVAVVGIGGLGHLAIQYAKAAGFETIAVTKTKDKVKLARALGADDVVQDGAALAKAGGADVLLACSNSYRATADCFLGMRPDGRVAVMGFSAEPFEVPVKELLFKRLRVVGSLQNGREYLKEALDLAARGDVKVALETFALADFARAYDRVAKGEARFRAVITC